MLFEIRTSVYATNLLHEISCNLEKNVVCTDSLAHHGAIREKKNAQSVLLKDFDEKFDQSCSKNLYYM